MKTVTLSEILTHVEGDNIPVLSIKPEYVKLIFQNKKKFEFRKKLPIANFEYILVYASSPIQRIVGILKVDYLLKNTPLGLWRKTKREANDKNGIEFKAYKEYFKDCRTANAIKIKKSLKLTDTISIEELREKIGFTPPQNFSYISKNELISLKR